MKLAVIGDLHLSEKSPRYAHALQLTRWAVQDALEQGAQCFFFLGDIFEGAPAPGEYGEFIQILFDALGHGGYVGIVRGNHEHYEALCFFEGLHPMLIVAWDDVRTLDLGDIRLLLVPYPTRYKAPYQNFGLEFGDTIAGSMRAAAAKIEDWIQKATPDDERPLIVLGHFSIEGMTTRDAEFEVHQANEVVVPISAFRGPDLTVVGHIHRAQDVAPHVLGAGSLYRCSFAEAEDPKSYVLVTIEMNEAGKATGVQYERRPVPAREMQVYEVELDELPSMVRMVGGLLEAAVGREQEIEVKFTVSMDEEQAPRYDPAIFDGLKRMAAHLVIEKLVRPKQRTRAPQMTVSMDLSEQVVAWLQATEQLVDPERIARLTEKVAGLG